MNTTLQGAFKAAGESREIRKLGDLINSPDPRFCPECSAGRQRLPALGSRGFLTEKDAQSGLEGMLTWFPRESDIPGYSLAHQQPAVNAGAYNHPCLIIEASACRHYVFCAPVTGFGAAGLKGKYKNARPDHDIFFEYIPIKHADTGAHNALGMLEHSGEPMMKPSWVHLDGGFWIEWRFLKPINAPCKVPGDRRLRHLLPKSLSWIARCYAIAEEYRQSRCIPAQTMQSQMQPHAQPPYTPLHVMSYAQSYSLPYAPAYVMSYAQEAAPPYYPPAVVSG